MTVAMCPIERILILLGQGTLIPRSRLPKCGHGSRETLLWTIASRSYIVGSVGFLHGPTTQSDRVLSANRFIRKPEEVGILALIPMIFPIVGGLYERIEQLGSEARLAYCTYYLVADVYVYILVIKFHLDPAYRLHSADRSETKGVIGGAERVVGVASDILSPCVRGSGTRKEHVSPGRIRLIGFYCSTS